MKLLGGQGKSAREGICPTGNGKYGYLLVPGEHYAFMIGATFRQRFRLLSPLLPNSW